MLIYVEQALAARRHAAISGYITADNDIDKMELRGRGGKLLALFGG